MRSPHKPDRRPYEAGTPPSVATIALSRLAFGPRPGEIAAFEALGGDDTSRLTAYVDQQLNPAAIDDSDVDNRLATSGFTTLGKSLTQLWADHEVGDYEIRSRPLWETDRATFLRAIFSKRQLFEVLVDFWHNHFSVNGGQWELIPVMVHYDRDVIRGNALGNFRQMVEDVTRSTSMLFYLDNFLNSVDGPNENFARELLELHTLGADAYYGVIPQGSVPTDAQGNPLGFVDDDVFAATKCLTGWSVRHRWWDPDIGDTGEFIYIDEEHDHSAKTFLGVNFPASQAPMKDGLDLLDLIANHPATGRFIAAKLCRRLIGDGVPSSLINQVGAFFTSQAAAPDQIAQTVRMIVLSNEFRSTWGQKVKRPFEIITSTLRAMGTDFDVTFDSYYFDTFSWLFGQAGQYPFRWKPPNGYPDVSGAWLSASPRVQSWRVCNWFSDMDIDDQGTKLYDVMAQTPVGVRSASALADYWIDRILSRPMHEADRAEIVAFMAQGRNPNFDLPLDTDDDAQDRLRTMVGLLTLTPDFLSR